jgi:hypothetical protein
MSELLSFQATKPDSEAPPAEPPAPSGGGTPDVMDADFDSVSTVGFDHGLTDSTLKTWFGQSGFFNSFAEFELSIVAESGRGNVLRQRYVPDNEPGYTHANGTCTGTDPVGCYMDLDTAADTMFMQYDIFFESTFNFDTDGGKLPALSSGGDYLSLVPPQYWNARLMFRRGGNIVLYAYHYDKPGQYGEDFQFRNADTSLYYAPKETWLTIRQKIVMNSNENTADGNATCWVDGEQKLDETLRWYGPNTLAGHRQVGGFLYSSFYGGNTSAYCPGRTSYARFDNFEVATSDTLLTGGAY